MGRGNKHIQNFSSESANRRDHMGNVAVGGRIILKWFMREEDVTGFI
jgi:hypothetical protein